MILFSYSWRQGLGSFNKGSSSLTKLEAGSSSVQDEAEDMEEQPLVRNRSRRASSGSIESLKEVGEMDEGPPTGPGSRVITDHPLHNGGTFPAEVYLSILAIDSILIGMVK